MVSYDVKIRDAQRMDIDPIVEMTLDFERYLIDSSRIGSFGLRCCWKTEGFPNIERILGFFNNSASIVIG